MAKENPSNLDFHKQFGFPFAPFNVPGFVMYPATDLSEGQICFWGEKKVVAK